MRLVEFASKTKSFSGEPKQSAAVLQLEKLIQSAEKSLTGDELDSYYKDILRLYRDKPWASEQIGRIERKLNALQ